MTDTDLRREAAGRRQGTLHTLWSRLPKDLNDPLLRNAYSLIVNAGAAGVLGLVYWTIAVRFYSEGDYGRASALIAAMRLLAALTAFGFVGALTRFLPEGVGRPGAWSATPTWWAAARRRSRPWSSCPRWTCGVPTTTG